MIKIWRFRRTSRYDRFMNHRAVVTAVELGQSIREARIERGLQQADLAERVGVSRMTISRLERGESVSVETAMRCLSECGRAIAVVPKFSRIEVRDG